jgi:hypothetical protein
MTGEQAISPGDIVSNAALAAVTNGVGAALGSLASKQVGAMVVEKIMAKYAFKQVATKLIVTGIVEGSLGSTVQSVVAQTPDLLRGRTTWEKFATAVALAFIAGGIAGAIQGKMNARNPNDFKGMTREEIEAALDEVGEKGGAKPVSGTSKGQGDLENWVVGQLQRGGLTKEQAEEQARRFHEVGRGRPYERR